LHLTKIVENNTISLIEKYTTNYLCTWKEREREREKGTGGINFKLLVVFCEVYALPESENYGI
jgi:hypothetical protein